MAESASDAAMPPTPPTPAELLFSTALSATLLREAESASRTPLRPSAASRAPPAAPSRAGRRPFSRAVRRSSTDRASAAAAAAAAAASLETDSLLPARACRFVTALASAPRAC